MSRHPSDFEGPRWARACAAFLATQFEPGSGAFRSVPAGPGTLYGTCYALLARHYLGGDELPEKTTRDFILDCQDSESGLFVGPELRGFEARPGAMHDREHLILHLTCAALPTCQQFSFNPPHPLRAARKFLDLQYLQNWLNQRNLRQAWFEGNNLLFVGQLLVYLRDVERVPGASAALGEWFHWLDQTVDPRTGLWGTDEFCGPAEAVYGGYHQLLVYFYENHPITHPRGLVDVILRLQHADGGFHPGGNAGACEDVDCVDLLVRCYHQLDYRRPDIRVALKRCLHHILETQNHDGGFPYHRDHAQNHMEIPGTFAAANTSTMFPTWFRVHTLSLIAQVLPREPNLDWPFRFSRALSMGWYSPPPAQERAAPIRFRDWLAELPAWARCGVAISRNRAGRIYRAARRFSLRRGV